MSHPVSHVLVAWWIRFRWVFLLLGVLACGLLWETSRQLSFDRSIENMFAEDDPLLVPFRQMKRTFGGTEVAVAAYVDPNLMTPEGFERLDELTKKLAQVPGVENVLSPTTTPLGTSLVSVPGVGERFLQLFEGYTIGTDRQTAAVACLLDPQPAPGQREVCVAQLQEIIQAHDPSGVLAGEPVMVAEGFATLDRDGSRLGLISTGLLMFTIFICFRSVRWMLIPLVVVQAALIWTQGLLVLSQFRLSMVSSMLWAVVNVVGIAMVIHLIVRYRAQRQQQRSPARSLWMAGAALAGPIAWTALTDAAGFASLRLAHVGPVRDFGLMMAWGTLLVTLAVTMFVPGLSLWGKFDADPRMAWGEAHLSGGLARLNRWHQRHGLAVILVSLVLAAVALWGCWRLQVETDFTKNFRADSQIVRSYSFVESRLGGAGVWDVLVPAPDKLTPEYLQRVATLEDRLRSEVKVDNSQGEIAPGLTKVLSLPDMLAAAPDIDVPGLSFLLGKERLEARKFELKMTALRSQMPEVLDSLYGRDPKTPEDAPQYYLRIMLRALERQTAPQKNAIIRQVTAISEEEFPPSENSPGAQVTGFFVLLARLIDSMIQDQWFTFAVATCAIGAMMAVAFRSIPLAVVALVPNILPILLVSGAMGWLGFPINMGAAMIAAVSIGLAVDSSIHFIEAYRRLRHHHHTRDESLAHVSQSVGRAIVFSTLALIVGFSALAFSEFVPTIYFGVLVSLALLGGLAGNLLLLPVLIRLVERNEPLDY